MNTFREWIEIHNNAPKMVPQTRIPYLIFRTGKEPLHFLRTSIRENLDSFAHREKKYVHVYSSDEDCNYFVREYFPNMYEAFKDLLPGAFRADMWRLLVIWQFGGMYSDLGHTFLCKLSDILKGDTELILVTDALFPLIGVSPQGIHNAFIAAYPQHPLIAKFILHTYARIHLKMYGTSPLDITGPVLLGKVFLQVLNNSSKQEALTKGKIKFVLNGKNSAELNMMTLYGDYIVDADNRRIIKTKTPDYYNEVYGRAKNGIIQWNRYLWMWVTGNVYASTSHIEKWKRGFFLSVLIGCILMGVQSGNYAPVLIVLLVIAMLLVYPAYIDHITDNFYGTLPAV